jgi:hypothetical protein
MHVKKRHRIKAYIYDRNNIKEGSLRITGFVGFVLREVFYKTTEQQVSETGSPSVLR